MKKRIIALFLVLCIVLAVTGCSKSAGDSKLTVTFIDVGQGDAALVECGGEYMLIDTGPNNKTTGEIIRKLLLDKGIYTLKYLVISHLHDDHYGGLINNALQNVEIKATLCNEDPYRKSNVASCLDGSRLIIPKAGEEFSLGSATIKVVDVSSNQANDSLVLLISYENTNFLFTGDIEKEAHSRVAEKLRELSNELEGKENLIKMPHHGAYNSDQYLPNDAYDNSLNTLVSASYAEYFVISVGKNNSYNHPHRETLELIDQVLEKHNLDKTEHFFRTDENGDIVVTSDGKTITVIPAKQT
ncbi:MAG: MBL fold metallo-hydrolase [Oscillospiraceae bacterium]|nr:MBL fold metallo-hydrolase [Oscillospiraceae bacterium]